MKAPKGTPNVLLILLDDTGFGQYATFGGGVPSPTMDKLAAEGPHSGMPTHRQGSFKSFPIQNDDHFLMVCR
jgi:hypothetical protein